MDKLIKELNYYTHVIDTAIKTPHFHNGYELIYVVNGCVEIEINRILHSVSAPAIILLNPFEWHKIISADKEYLRYTLIADSALLEREVNPRIVSVIKCRPEGFRHVIGLNREITFYINRIFSILHKESQEDRPYKDRLIANEIYNLLILIYRICDSTASAYNENMMHIQQYIDENYATISNVEDIAARFYITAGYLSRAFKKYSGYTPVEYLINTRLYNAQLLLINSNDNIVNICSAVGFRDINNFTRQFRIKYGMPPLAFRKLQHSVKDSN